MTPRELLAEIGGLGYRLSLHGGCLRLSGKGEPASEVLSLIRENRESLLFLLKVEARAWADHEASLAAGRVTPVPAHLLQLVHPSLRPIVSNVAPRQVHQEMSSGHSTTRARASLDVQQRLNQKS
jgi:hypothetical protein